MLGLDVSKIMRHLARNRDWAKTARHSDQQALVAIYLVLRTRGRLSRFLATRVRAHLRRPAHLGAITIDESDMYYRKTSPTCSSCLHRIGFDLRSSYPRINCQAFHHRIPRAIWDVENGHDDWFPGDRGYRYAPMTRSDWAIMDLTADMKYKTRGWQVNETRRLTLEAWRKQHHDDARNMEEGEQLRAGNWIWY